MFIFAQYLKYWSTEGNQIIQFGQLIEYYVKNIFFQKSCRKWASEASSRSSFFFKKSFIWGKKSFSGTSFSTTFYVSFFSKSISLVIFYYLTKGYCLSAFSYWDIGQYVYYSYLLRSRWRHKFWNQLRLPLSRHFPRWPKK